MGTIEENLQHWSDSARWPDRGEGWSGVWGGSATQWAGTLLPRIHRFLPAKRMLEIGCGFGRWSRRLRPWCEELVLVDIVDACLEACREEFAAERAVSVWKSDGRHLPPELTGTVDFVFSFDSLVHAEIDVVEAYVSELARVLAPRGAAFLHLSNFEAVLAAKPGTYNHHWRAESVTAERVARALEGVGLSALRQEIVDWDRVAESDVLTTVVRQGSGLDEEPIRRVNSDFMAEARSLAARAELYGAPGE